MRNAVVLPHPLGPSRLTSSPGASSRSSAAECDVLAERLAHAGVVEGRGHRWSSCQGQKMVAAASALAAALADQQRDQPEQHPAGEQREQGRARCRRGASWRLRSWRKTGNVCLNSNEARVNSPSTTVAVRNAEPTRATRMLGISTRNRVRAPAGTERARRVDQRAQVDGPQPGVEGPEGERHGHHRVERDEEVVVAEEPAGVVTERPQRSGGEGDRRHHVRQQREHLDQRPRLGQAQVHEQRGGQQERQRERAPRRPPGAGCSTAPAGTSGRADRRACRSTSTCRTGCSSPA